MQSSPTFDEFFKLFSQYDPREVKRLYDLKDEVHKNIERSQAIERSIIDQRQNNEYLLEALRTERSQWEDERTLLRNDLSSREQTLAQNKAQLDQFSEHLKGVEEQLRNREQAVSDHEHHLGKRDADLNQKDYLLTTKHQKLNKITEDLRETLCQLT